MAKVEEAAPERPGMIRGYSVAVVAEHPAARVVRVAEAVMVVPVAAVRATVLSSPQLWNRASPAIPSPAGTVVQVGLHFSTAMAVMAGTATQSTTEILLMHSSRH